MFAQLREAQERGIWGSPDSPTWLRQAFVFGLLFAMLVVAHLPLLGLPYFWDEAGYYVPAAHDLYTDGALIPHSTVSNAHPPLVLAWLALAWNIAGYSPFVTHTAMLAIAAFALLGIFRLSCRAANIPVAAATVGLVALYPVFFSQSSLAQLDVAAAAFTFWGLLAYVEDRPGWVALWFSIAALTKETTVLAPLVLLGWELAWSYVQKRGWTIKLDALAPPIRRTTLPGILLIPLVPLAGWYAFHFVKTGYLLGNPEFFRYNVSMTVNAARIPFAFGIRLWQMFGYFGLYLLTLAGVLAMTRKPQPKILAAADSRQPCESRPRIPFWIQGAFLAVVLAYLVFMSAIGGAALARYMLPVVPLVMIVLISTLWRRVRWWWLIVSMVAMVFVVGLFRNPPYGFSVEDNLAYRDFVTLHEAAIDVLQQKSPQARVLTAWPASDELNRPWLGYVQRSFPVIRMEDFTAAEIEGIARQNEKFDVVLAFSTKYEPMHPLFAKWKWWVNIKEKFFGYHEDLRPEEIAEKLGARVVFQQQKRGQWVALIDAPDWRRPAK